MNMKKIILFTLAVLILALVIYMIFGKDRPGDSKKNEDENFNIIHSLSDGDWETPRPNIPESNLYQIQKKKFIKEIVFEKDPICAGEDFEVIVMAENPDGPETELTYSINGKYGNPIILRFNKAGKKPVNVFVRDARENVDHKRFTINIIDCPDKPVVHLAARFSNSRADEAEFEVVKMIGLAGDCTYEWDFGDGTSGKTDAGFTTHNYGKREQNQFSSTFVASVSVTDSNGTVAVGRASLSFPNIHWISNQMGQSIVPVIYDRFPKRDGNRYEVALKIKNIYDENIRFTDVEFAFRSCAEGSGKKDITYSAGTVLSKTEIGAGEIQEDVLSFTSGELLPSTCGILITLKGSFPDERAVTGRINLTIPMTAEEAKKSGRGVEVTDPELIRKIREAKRILGKDVITPSDIRRLEKEGKL